MITTRSLSFFVSVWIAVAVAASMAVYAAYEYATMPGHTLRELAVEHLGHVLGLGILVYVLCWGVFYFLLLRPLNRIYLHLYTIGAGRLSTIELDSNVREIRTIVDGVNLMLSRLKQGADSNALELSQKRIAEIREMTRHLTTLDQEHISVLLDKLADLEKSLPGILAREGTPKASCAVVGAKPFGQPLEQVHPSMLQDCRCPGSEA
jgi:methyl-accepting chemotaxis protein